MNSGLWVSFPSWPKTLPVLGLSLQWTCGLWAVLSTDWEPCFVVLNFTLWFQLIRPTGFWVLCDRPPVVLELGQTYISQKKKKTHLNFIKSCKCCSKGFVLSWTVFFFRQIYNWTWRCFVTSSRWCVLMEEETEYCHQRPLQCGLMQNVLYLYCLQSLGSQDEISRIMGYEHSTS